MGFNVDVKWKIKFNGKEYSSVEEMPPAERAIYERAVKETAAPGHSVTFKTTSTKIIFNGKEYANPDAMPEDVRETYLKLMKAVSGGKTQADEKTVVDAASALVRSGPSGTTDVARALRPIVPESISARKLFVGAVILAVLAALYFLTRG